MLILNEPPYLQSMTPPAQRPNQSPAMDEQKAFSCSTKIYKDLGDHLRPLVQFTCRGEVVTFLLDTGCYESSVTSRQKAILGYDDEMWDNEDY